MSYSGAVVLEENAHDVRALDGATILGLGLAAHCRGAATRSSSKARVQAIGSQLTGKWMHPASRTGTPSYPAIYKVPCGHVMALNRVFGYLAGLYSSEEFPLVSSEEHNFGIIHRLDLPSSGLILVGAPA